jgi:hypothetical protein
MSAVLEANLLVAVLVITLVGYGFVSMTLRGKNWNQWSRMSVRLVAATVVFSIIIWPLVQDSLFVEHFSDEATMPGSAFASFYLLIWAACLWAVYALFRLITLSLKNRKPS